MDLVEFRSFEDELHPCSNVILSANKYIRKMKGGSQANLVRANDGKHYVVKMMDNPGGPNVLANEHLGSLIARSVGLPVAEAKGILLSDSFIDSHPDLWFELQSGKRRPEKGVHFASLLVGQTSGAERPTEYISPSGVDLITNREAFLGMYLLDVWANHQDSRQAILRRRRSNSGQEVIFIDHGHMFGGPEWDFNDNSRSALHSEMAVYTNLWQDEQIASWISRFQAIVPEVLTSAAQSMPSDWYRGDIARLIGGLAARLVSLPDLIQETAAKNWHPLQEKRVDEPSRLSSAGIHRLRTRAEGSVVHQSRATA